MRFAQSSFVYFNYPLKQAIRRLHQFGYRGIEIWGGRPHMYRHDLDDELDAIRALLDVCEMAVPNLIPAQFRYPSILCSSNEAVRLWATLISLAEFPVFFDTTYEQQLHLFIEGVDDCSDSLRDGCNVAVGLFAVLNLPARDLA